MVKNLPASAGDLGSIPMSRRSLRRKWQLTQVFLPGKSHAQRRLVGYCPWDCKESDMTEQLILSILSHIFHRVPSFAKVKAV